jgi:hypothetical protein
MQELTLRLGSRQKAEILVQADKTATAAAQLTNNPTVALIDKVETDRQIH